MRKLRVLPSGTAMVPDFEAQEQGVRRFIGRKLDVEKGGFVPLDEPVEVPFRAEYLLAVRDGDLECADEASAQLCCVPFHKS